MATLIRPTLKSFPRSPARVAPRAQPRPHPTPLDKIRRVVLPTSHQPPATSHQFEASNGKTRIMTGGHDWFALNPPFDAQYRLVTSGFLPPFWLFITRLAFAVYAVTANIINLIWYLDVLHEPLER